MPLPLTSVFEEDPSIRETFLLPETEEASYLEPSPIRVPEKKPVNFDAAEEMNRQDGAERAAEVARPVSPAREKSDAQRHKKTKQALAEILEETAPAAAAPTDFTPDGKDAATVRALSPGAYTDEAAAHAGAQEATELLEEVKDKGKQAPAPESHLVTADPWARMAAAVQPDVPPEEQPVVTGKTKGHAGQKKATKAESEAKAADKADTEDQAETLVKAVSEDAPPKAVEAEAAEKQSRKDTLRAAKAANRATKTVKTESAEADVAQDSPADAKGKKGKRVAVSKPETSVESNESEAEASTKPKRAKTKKNGARSAAIDTDTDKEERSDTADKGDTQVTFLGSVVAWIKQPMPRMTLTLFLITAVAALLLGFVYSQAQPLIDKHHEGALRAAISEVLPGADTEPEPVTGDSFPDMIRSVYKLTQGGNLLGYAVEAAPTGFSGAISLMVGVGPDGGVTRVLVVDMSETPGVGTRVSDEAWFLEQFAGRGDGALSLGADGVQVITNATVSSTAVANGVQAAVRTASALMRATGEAS